MYKSQMILYYSDQRDPKYGQKLVHQTSSDLRTWDPPVDDVAHSPYTARPGMTTVARLPDGRYIMSYEYGGGPGAGSGYTFPVFYRIAEDPRQFANAADHPVKAGSTVPIGSPYVTWSSVGGRDGSIIVSDGTGSRIFVNRAMGDESKWVAYSVPQPEAYTRHLRVLNADPSKLLIMGAGHLPPSTTNKVSLSVVDLKQLMNL